ncbi:hypothetical protein [Idiomarina xiamenensis]|uniref:Lipoprotein n=1 Tax=Idiomarina xiamenensis 10-D-4 TaxID=740709 RepID=K2KGG9_9GAMM|nr:hypothetical protein [Idiomarina xiamenensis]EKE87083.1 hypothetical protein A10D4_02547 [Idiomarina xiamenensis 10-D-4]
MSKVNCVFILCWLVSGCAQKSIIGSSQVIGFHGNQISLTSTYQGEDSSSPAKSIDDYETAKLFGIDDDTFALSFFATRPLHQCFSNEHALAKKVRSLIADEFSLLLDGINLNIYLVPKTNFAITSKKTIGSSSPLHMVFAIDDAEGCDSGQIESHFKHVINTIIHEHFHLFVQTNDIGLTELDEEVLAYTVGYCNEIYATHAKSFSLNINTNSKAQIRIASFSRYATSLRAYYLFQDKLEALYYRHYQGIGDNQRLRAKRFINALCADAKRVVTSVTESKSTAG